MLLHVLLVSFVFMSENFESGNIPSTWSIYDHGITGSTWFAASSGTEWLEPDNHGNYYALLDYMIDSIANDTLVSPSVDITNPHSSLYLIYSMAFVGDTSSPDTGIVIIRYHSSSSGWGSWTDVMVYCGNMIQQTETIDIYNDAQNMDSLQVGFVYSTDTTGGGGYFAVDNVEVSGDEIVSNDVAVLGIISPSGYIGTSSTPVQVTVSNNSGSTITNVPLSVIITDTLTGNTVYNNSTTFDIQPQETIMVTLADFTAPDDTSFYNIMAYTSLAGDPSPSNDTAYSFAYSYPVFGTVLSKWEIVPQDSFWWGADYNRGILYILNALTGEIIGFNPGAGTFYHVTTLDTMFDGNRLVFWDLAYDYETGNWWVTAFKNGGASNYSYVLKYDSNWDLIAGRAVPSGSDSYTVGVPAVIDDKPFDSDVLYTASYEFMQAYTLVENNFDNLDSITFIDSVTVGQIPSGLPATLGLVCDTLFLMQSSGCKVINLVAIQGTDAYRMVAIDSLDLAPTGGDIEYSYGQDPSNWVIAYFTVSGRYLYKVSMGLKWDKVIAQENKHRKSNPAFSTIIQNGVLPAGLFSKLKGKNIRVYSPDGRILFEGKITSPRIPVMSTGVFFIKARGISIRVISR